MIRKKAIGLTAAVLALGAFQVSAQAPGSVDEKDPTAMGMAADMLLARPLGLVATVIGTTVFVVALPITVFQDGGVENSAAKLVVEPARYTFVRPLGESE